MKLARYEHNGFAHLGIIRHGMVNDLNTPLDVLEVLNLPRAERDHLETTAGRRHRAPLGTVRLLPPIEPRAMRDFVTFERHIAGMKKAAGATVPDAWYDVPIFLFMNPWALVGANDAVPAPPDSTEFDVELEVAAIIGRTARNVATADADAYIAGYCIMNDWSARDVQNHEMSVGLGPSKGKDFATTLGPWITTSDELDEFRDADGRLALEMVLEINGVEVGRDTTASMSWSFAEMMAHASRAATVGAGDVLASGTCSGGSLAEIWAHSGTRTPPALVPGDVVTMRIDGLGEISNAIVEPETVPERVPARERAA